MSAENETAKKSTPKHHVCGGTVVFRQVQGAIEVLLVKLAAHNEWGFPKGHLDKGETLAECAVRETLEETGVQVRLSMPLPLEHYVMPNGNSKEVHYWLAEPTTATDDVPRTPSPKEITAVEWVSLESAYDRMPYESQRSVLRSVLQVFREEQLPTSTLIVLRHTSALGRKKWDGKELLRPLASDGASAAQRLVQIIECWRPQRLFSSPATRCRDTLAPYAEVHGSTVQLLDSLSEPAHEKDPDSTWQSIDFTSLAAGVTLLCTHRPVLATVFKELSSAAAPGVEVPQDDPYLKPGEVLVLHRQGSRVVAAEHVSLP